jgi:hypothetical protein
VSESLKTADSGVSDPQAEADASRDQAGENVEHELGHVIVIPSRFKTAAAGVYV